MKGKRMVVVYRDEAGLPRAGAVGLTSDPDRVREDARYQAEAYQLMRAVVDGAEPRLRREEVVVS